VSSAIISFETISNTEVLSGYLTASDDSGIGTISTTYNGATYNCTFDPDTYAVSCSPG
jgi:hypothetical protein